MWTELIEALNAALAEQGEPQDIAQVGALLRAVDPAFARVQVLQEDLPYGRYLVHKGERFNVQLMVYSANYTGRVHCHETWGFMRVLKGHLFVSEWVLPDGVATQLSDTTLTPGGGQTFCAPRSDWHKVFTLGGPQTVSLHVYGAGMDMDEGIYLDDHMQPARAPRSAFGDMQRLLPHLAVG